MSSIKKRIYIEEYENGGFGVFNDRDGEKETMGFCTLNEVKDTLNKYFNVKTNEKTKTMPLLILGKRQTGKTTALSRIGETIINPAYLSPNWESSEQCFNDKRNAFSVNDDVLNGDRDKEYNWLIDEFTMCNKLPTNGKIVAIADDIDNIGKVMKKLKEMGYPVFVSSKELFKGV